jgi:AraC-like DNA-binding protein
MSSAQYSTDCVTASQRFEFWKEVVCRHCIPATSKPLTENTFDGQLAVRDMGLLDICTLSSTIHYWERTAKHLRTGPDDDLWLGFSLKGQGQLEQGGRNAILEPGNLFLYDASQTFRFSLGGYNHLTRIPRHLLSSRIPDIENLTAMVLDDRRPGVTPLREMLIQAASSTTALSADISHRFSQTILDLLVLSLELQDVKKAASEKDLYWRVMNYIRRNLAEQDMSLEKIAKAHHVSTRTVTRAFARHQKSPMSVVWQERLLASREAIENGSINSVSRAAMDFGFTDFSHFSHAFRKAFGVAPQSLLCKEPQPH